MSQIEKVANELLHRRRMTPREKKLHKKLVQVYGYNSDANKFYDAVDEEVRLTPELSKLYTSTLIEVRKKEEKDIRRILAKAILASGKPNAESEKIKYDLDQKTIPLGRALTVDQAGVLQTNFKSGNFLLHTTSIEKTISILQLGAILTSAELAATKRESWGRGGVNGISFNFNDVRVLTGDTRHFSGFLADPLAILDRDSQLVVPPKAAKYEAQLVHRSYVRPKDLTYNVSPLEASLYEYETLPRVPTRELFLFCREGDAPLLKELIARSKQRLRGVITYPTSKLRTESWTEPIGDYKIAGKLLKETFSKSGILPSFDWKRFFRHNPKIRDETYVEKESIDESNFVVKDGDNLEVVQN